MSRDNLRAGSNPESGSGIGLSPEVAHKLRGRLAGISHAAELLKVYGCELPQDRRDKYLNYILDGARGFSRLIDDLAWFEKLNKGRIRAMSGTCGVRSLVEDARRLLPEFESDQRLRMEWEDSQAEVFLDGCLAAVALSKVLRNAFVYSAPDSEIRLVVRHEPSRLLFRVEDHGIGIPSDELPRIGEAFYRGSNVGSVPGSGMGIAIARACVERLGGDLSCESKAGMGTQVDLAVPLGVPDSSTSNVGATCSRT